MSAKFFDLSNKVILVTGAAGHLGAAISKRLYQAGATLYLNGRSEDKIHALIAEIENGSDRLHALPFDISDEASRKRSIESIKENYGRLDGLVNNAFTPLSGSIHEATAEDFQTSFGVNVSGTFALSQDCFPLMQRSKEDVQKYSSIVNVASMYGIVSPDPSIYGDSGMNNPPFYGASKAALLQLTRYFAGHATDMNIRTNAVSPGPFPPESVRENMPEFHEELCKKTPMRRIGEPEEVASVVHFLLSDDSSYVNGANISVDGGWTAW